jgi:hypothetical protein
MTTQQLAARKAWITRRANSTVTTHLTPAQKAWQTRRKNAALTTVRQTTNNPVLMTSVQARDLHKQVNKLDRQSAIQMLHTMIDFARGKNV